MVFVVFVLMVVRQDMGNVVGGFDYSRVGKMVVLKNKLFLGFTSMVTVVVRIDRATMGIGFNVV